ncbi:hypothetical protein FRC00_009426 [Tulasnella sp. 408]|nr:hypothetical protein FRC00_009426 [Tulasnella sp. 408]
MTDSFRKIDIDAFDEDVLLESDLVDPDPRDPATVLADAKSKNTQLRSFLSKGDTAGALALVLADAPYGPNVDEAKVRLFILLPAFTTVADFDLFHYTFATTAVKAVNLASVMLILNSTKAADIPNIVRTLPQDAQDTLMKYLYKGMGSQGDADANPSVLLSWHEKSTQSPKEASSTLSVSEQPRSRSTSPSGRSPSPSKNTTPAFALGDEVLVVGDVNTPMISAVITEVVAPVSAGQTYRYRVREKGSDRIFGAAYPEAGSAVEDSDIVEEGRLVKGSRASLRELVARANEWA